MLSLFPVDPPMTSPFPGISVEPESARSILRPQKDPHHGFGYALSPYRGCSHGCRYCYLRAYPNTEHLPSDWGKWVAPKLNAAELLWGQRHKLIGASVFMSTGTDPYQPLEKTCRLSRACLEVLLQCPTTQVLVHTRSALVLRDLDLLKAFGPRLSVGLSIPTDDDTVRQILEPTAPTIPTRWATAERLSAAGIAVHIAATPLLPMTDPGAYARRARDSGVSTIWVGRLRLLKNDPMYDLLAHNGWLNVLSPEYAEEVRNIIHPDLSQLRRFPRHKDQTQVHATVSKVLRIQSHPGLFDALSADALRMGTCDA
jgi:DNA repair photolyase